MRRLVVWIFKAIVLVVGGVAILSLARQASAGMAEIGTHQDQMHVYDQHSGSFSAAATTIGQENVQISLAETNSPVVQTSPTIDESFNTGDGGDNDGDGSQGSPPTGPIAQLQSQIPSPTETPTEVQPPTSTATTTEASTEVSAETATETSTTASTTAAPTVGAPATNTRPAATRPPTNTKRAPTATLTPPPPSATFTASPTLPPTASSTPTLAPTNKLPTVVLPAARTERPQVTAIPSAAPRLKSNGQDIMNILLIGSDQDVDPSDPSFRTDSMVVVSINRTANSVSMLSIPRDLFVYIPSLGMQRINVAYQWGQSVGYRPDGGWGALRQTILWNLGIPLHYYARVSLEGFKTIVDTLSGVNVAVDCPISDLRFQGKYNEQQTPVYEPFTLNTGYYHMDGSLALWYARMRTSTSDFDRNRRQQQVLRALWRTARDQGLITKAPELWGQLTGIVDTSMALPDVLGLVPLAISLKPGDIRSYYMQKGWELQHWKTPAGEDVQLPSPEGFFQTINDFYTPPTSNRLGAQAATVEVVNGSTIQDSNKIAADRLTWEGFEVTDSGGGDQVAKSVVYDFTGNAKPGALATLLKSTNLKPGQVISQPDPNRTVDFRLVLSDDYRSCTAAGFN